MRIGTSKNENKSDTFSSNDFGSVVCVWCGRWEAIEWGMWYRTGIEGLTRQLLNFITI